ncbi:MAG TPA: phosphoribosylamine--glycine ligase [Solimonas sp.]|nr:phosphoribosylamine--glycine ligase [Solimonas sp.]
MKVLVIGGGGREHALAWKLAQSQRVSEVLVAPGNAGTAYEPRCRNIPIAAEDVAGLLRLAQQERIGFTVVGPEGPLALGLVDEFTRQGLRVFGPTRQAAQLESSKAFAKDFLARHRIPTARYETHTELPAAERCIRAFGAPVVVKADGLAAGKGVVVATSVDEALAAARDMLGGNTLGDAGRRVVIEEFLDGEEASFIVVAAGGRFVEMATSQDHKRVGDGDTGPNTGGMGAYSPAPVVTAAVRARVLAEVIEPTLAGLARDGIDYTGFLYAGLMINDSGAPRVLEFNCRLGDPETQPLLLRLSSGLIEILEAAVDRRLDQVQASWDPRPALGVVMAAHGYPASVRKGDPIHGLDSDFGTAKVFHAGTTLDDGRAVTSGGRVLCVAAQGDTVRAAQAAAYAAVARIHWDGEHHRGDIGYRAIAREQG